MNLVEKLKTISKLLHKHGAFETEEMCLQDLTRQLEIGTLTPDFVDSAYDLISTGEASLAMINTFVQQATEHRTYLH